MAAGGGAPTPRSHYAHAYSDSRVSGRVKLEPFDAPSSSGPTLSLLLAKSLLALALCLTKDWLTNQNYSTVSILPLALLLPAFAYAVLEKLSQGGRGTNEHSTAALYGTILVLESLFFLLALSKLSVLRLLALTSFATLWTRGALPVAFLSSLSTNTDRTSRRSTVGKNNAIFTTVAMIFAAYIVDVMLSPRVAKSGYMYLLIHLLACGQRSELLSHVFGSDPSGKGKFHAVGTIFATVISLFLAGVRWVFSSTAAAVDPDRVSETLNNLASATDFALPPPSLSLFLPAACFFGFSFLLVDPLVTQSISNRLPPIKIAKTGWNLGMGAGFIIGLVGFGRGASLADFGVAATGWFAISHLLASDSRSPIHAGASSSGSTLSANSPPVLTSLSTFYKNLRVTLKTILATPESKRIYFFLCLNLAYMVVQMVYGIATNSLGLISDSIHMFFDCLALGMGLFASVMATWEPNGKFTYGYSRVETLSGFANGLFLCLISIFIVFEAIQRLLDPPEMNTSQLLVVSSVGLAVNLVGMVATGGHHHHGHSHGGHDHGHDHAPKPKPVKTSHDHDHASHRHGSHDHSGHGHSSHNHSSHDHSGHDHDDEDDEHAGHSHHGGHSHNMKGVFLHVLADTLGSVGVIISTLLINRYGWNGFDPLASIFIAVLIFASVVPLVADAGNLLVLDMGDEREAEVKNALLALSRVEGVASYSSPRFWAKDPSTMIGSIHIQLAPSPSTFDPTQSSSTVYHYAYVDKVTTRVSKCLKGGIGGLEELCVQVEPTRGFN